MPTLHIFRLGEVVDGFVGVQSQSVNESRYLLAIRKVLAQDYESGSQLLLDTVRGDRGFRDDAARKRLVELCNILEANNPLFRTYRGELYRLLN